MKNKTIPKNSSSKFPKDSEQQEVIKNTDYRLIVEAPAGYGKTFTMISMINYWFSINKIPKNKFILCLSFSVSAANRMKESIAGKFDDSSQSDKKSSQIWTTNFHGFCRSVLKKYGYLVGIKNINKLKSVECNKKNIKINSSKDQIDFILIHNLESSISSASISINQLLKDIPEYTAAQTSLFIQNGEITYDAIILFVLHLFKKYPPIQNGYQNIFKALCIDEFQDTNILGLALIQALLLPETKCVVFGDQMQQIYAFLGAIPNLIDKILERNDIHPKVTYIRLLNNYRFKNQPNMMALDTALHKFRKNPFDSSIVPVRMNLLHGTTIYDQSLKIIKKINSIKSTDPDATFAILVNQGFKTTECLINNIKTKLPLMDATFKAEDKDFIDFEYQALKLYQSNFNNHPITKSKIKEFCNMVKESSNTSNYKCSFEKLLSAFLYNSVEKFSSISRNDHIISTLSNQSLRQSLPDVETNVTVSTIHGAKGLEWDYIIIANFQQNEFPNYRELKNLGINNNKTVIDINKVNKYALNNITNKLYVAFSRAKKDVFFSYSDKGINYRGEEYDTRLSSLASLPIFK